METVAIDSGIWKDDYFRSLTVPASLVFLRAAFWPDQSATHVAMDVGLEVKSVTKLLEDAEFIRQTQRWQRG